MYAEIRQPFVKCLPTLSSPLPSAPMASNVKCNVSRGRPGTGLHGAEQPDRQRPFDRQGDAVLAVQGGVPHEQAQDAAAGAGELVCRPGCLARGRYVEFFAGSPAIRVCLRFCERIVGTSETPAACGSSKARENLFCSRQAAAFLWRGIHYPQFRKRRAGPRPIDG